MIKKSTSHTFANIGIGFSIMGIFSIYLIDNKYCTNFKLILPAFTTFLGAVLAFRLNSLKDDKEELKKKKSALNLALFVLARQHNALQNILKEIEPFRDKPNRAFSLPAIKPPEYNDLVQNFGDLSFLLDLDTNEIEILMKLTIVQEGFDVTKIALSSRNEMYIEELQKIISEKKLNGKNFTKEELVEIFGEKLFHGAIQGVDQIYKHVDFSAKEVPAAFSNLRCTAKKLFPKEKFIQVESLPKTTK
jgi:hypothetical protein